MATKALIAVAAGLIVAMLPLSTSAQSQEASVPAAESAFDRRAAQLVDVINGNIAFDAYFAPQFQVAVPEAQFRTMASGIATQYGRAVAVEDLHSANGRSGSLKLRFEKGVATVLLDAGALPDERVTGLRITGFAMSDDSFARVAGEIAALPGTAGFLVAEIDGDRFRAIAAANADRQFAVGSTFKLYILDELAAQIAAGQRQWSDVVPLTHLSFSSVATANWPKDMPVTLQTLANWMISVSDNGAADTLIHLLGRERIEARMRAAGHSDPSRNIPFLTTVEAFALKGNNFADLRGTYVKRDDAAQRKLLDTNASTLILANVDGVSFVEGPRFIESLEWFASPDDIARVMIDLKRRNSPQLMSALSINNGLGPEAGTAWSFLGYKGGSENGVLSMSFLGQRKSDAKWFAVTASWNNPAANVDTVQLVGFMTRLLALTAKS